MGPTWGWQDPGGPHVGPINFVIRVWPYLKFLWLIIICDWFLLNESHYKCPVRCTSFQALTSINTLRPRRSRRHFADDSFRCIFFYENVWISIKTSLKYIAKGPIINIPALVQIMAWRGPCDKPLSEPMLFSLLTHICVARPQWVNSIALGAFIGFPKDNNHCIKTVHHSTVLHKR